MARESWSMNKKHTFAKCSITIISISIFFIYLIIGMTKKGFFVDELLSFGLANNEFTAAFGDVFESGRIYTGEELWCTFFNFEGLNFKQLIDNQSMDVHPPLYYFLIHIFSVINHNHIGELWKVGILLNSLLGVLLFLICIQIYGLFVNNLKIQIVLAVFTVSFMGVVNNILLIRMYMLLTVFTTIHVLILLKFVEISTIYKEKCGKKAITFLNIYYLMALNTLLGVLTHYYFILFLVLSSAVCGFIVLFFERKCTVFIKALIASIVGVIAAFMYFPASFEHIFSGYRGTESFDNLYSNDLFVSNVGYYYKVINTELFGGYFALILGMALIIIFLNKRDNRLDFDKVFVEKISVILIPVLGFIVIVSRISVMQADRYIMCIMPLICIVFFVCCYKLLEKNRLPLMSKSICFVILVIILIFSSYRGGIPNLYYNVSKFNDLINQHSSDLCIVVRDTNENHRYEILQELSVMRELDKIIIYDSEEDAILKAIECSEYDRNFILYLDNGYSIDDLSIKMRVDKNSIIQIYSDEYITAYFITV